MYFIYFDYIHISSRETKKKEDHTGSSSWELYSLTEWYYTKHRFKLIEVSIPPEQCPPHTRCLCLCMKRFVREWISKKIDAKRHISWPLISHGQYYDCIRRTSWNFDCMYCLYLHDDSIIQLSHHVQLEEHAANGSGQDRIIATNDHNYCPFKVWS